MPEPVIVLHHGVFVIPEEGEPGEVKKVRLEKRTAAREAERQGMDNTQTPQREEAVHSGTSVRAEKPKPGTKNKSEHKEEQREEKPGEKTAGGSTCRPAEKPGESYG